MTTPRTTPPPHRRRGRNRRRGPTLFDRAFNMALAVIGVAIVFDAGWLQTPRERAGGILVLALALLFAYLALRPRR